MIIELKRVNKTNNSIKTTFNIEKSFIIYILLIDIIYNKNKNFNLKHIFSIFLIWILKFHCFFSYLFNISSTLFLISLLE